MRGHKTSTKVFIITFVAILVIVMSLTAYDNTPNAWMAVLFRLVLILTFLGVFIFFVKKAVANVAVIGSYKLYKRAASDSLNLILDDLKSDHIDEVKKSNCKPYQIAFNYCMAGDIEKAIEELSDEKLDGLEDLDANVFLLKAQLLELDSPSKNLREAEKNYLKFIDIHPTVDNYLCLAYLYDKLEEYAQSKKILQTCADKTVNIETLSIIAAGFLSIGKAEAVAGHYDDAKETIGHSIKLFRSLVEREPFTYFLNANLTMAITSLASWHNQIGEQETADKLYRQALEISKNIGEKYQRNPAYLKDFADNSIKFGSFQKEHNNFNYTLELYNEALEIYRLILAISPTKLTNHINVSEVVTLIGDLKYDREDYNGALKCYNEVLAINKSLADKDLGKSYPYQVIENMAKAYNKLGSIHLMLGKQKLALKNYHEALIFYHGLARLDKTKYQPFLEESELLYKELKKKK